MLKDAILVQESLWKDELQLWRESVDVDAKMMDLANRKRALYAASDMIMKSRADQKCPTYASLLQLFGNWKKQYEKDYSEAHGDLSLVDLLSPFVQVDLLLWDPFNSMPAYVFEERSWFLDSSQEDIVMAKLLSKTILPKLTRLISFAESNEHVMNKEGSRGWSFILNLRTAADLVDRCCKCHDGLVDKESMQSLNYLLNVNSHSFSIS